MTATAERVDPGILAAGRYRTTSIGILLVITLIAFEAMAVATAMPRAVAALHGLAYYGWPFTAFLVTSVVGMVTGGDRCDRDGPRRPLLTGIAVFGAGLLVAGIAPTMAVFVLGRAVQGFGGGMIVVSVYVLIAEVYEERLRPRMFAALSAAWVLPSLVGPVLAGLLTQHLTWRLVFLMIAPFVVISLALILPALRRLPAQDRPPARAGRWPIALVAAAGAAALQYAGQELRWWSLLPAVAGAAALVPSLRRLFPAGTFRLRVGLPSVVALRGLVAGAFFATDSYVPLTLTHVHGYGPTAAGAPLILGSVGWSAMSWWQGRHADTPRYLLVRAGFGMVAVAALAMTAIAVRHVPGWVSCPVWLVGGGGMGLVMPSLSILLLDFSPVAERGRNSSAMQIADMLTSALCIALGGALVAAAERSALSLPTAVTVIDLTMCAVALVGAVAAVRIREERGWAS